MGMTNSSGAPEAHIYPHSFFVQFLDSSRPRSPLRAPLLLLLLTHDMRGAW